MALLFILILSIVFFGWLGAFATSVLAFRRTTRRWACLISAAGSAFAAIGVRGASMLDDYNDFPGYTCAQRDSGHIPGIPASRWGPRGEEYFGSNIDWDSEVELFPLGLKCSYRTLDEPRLEATTHSNWSYSIFGYAFLAMSLVQLVRMFGPALGGSPSGGNEVERVDFPPQ
ncbi:Hypothetical protein BJL86_0159 [Dietzia timorensis]|uniref:Transmembrane protein n=2 Tax=Dietzia timorensis TaxID=499555 RepID=A0A173LK61_9ACTN|nr:Hypothetical protein BJL86_0159 [Dietzia timorensis]